MRKCQIKTALLTALTAFFCLDSGNSFAQYAVFDASNLAKAVEQLQQQQKSFEQDQLAYQKLVDQYTAQLDELEQATATFYSITGSRDLGDLLNSSAEQDLRRALPGDLQSLIAIDQANGLGSAASETQSIYNNYYTAYEPLAGEEYLAQDNEYSQAFDQNSQTTYAALAASESTYNNTSERLENYEVLLEKLNDSEDLKESVDLLSRISVENGLLLNEMMRLQAINTQMAAAKENQQLLSTKRQFYSSQYSAEMMEDFLKTQNEE